VAASAPPTRRPFPKRIQERIEEAGQAIVEMIRNEMVEAVGFRCHRDGGLGLLKPERG
jgi:hypothetical protein